MADFTGILGSRNAQPGTFVLGSGPTGVSLETVVVVSQSIDFEIQQGKWQRLIQGITVTPAITSAGSEINKTVTTTITVTPLATGLPEPFARVTQFVAEAVYSTAGYARVTQQVLEVVYKKANSQSVSHTITVTPAITRSGDNTQQVSHPVSVAQAVSGRDDHIRQSLSHTITVSQTIGRAGDFRQTVSQTINVTPAIVVVSDHNQSVSHTITVTPAIAERSSIIHQSVSHSISVTDSEIDSTNSIPKSVEHDVALNQAVDFAIETGSGAREVSMSVSHSITVNQTSFGRNSVVRISVTTTIGVSDGGDERGDHSHHVPCDINLDDDIAFVILTTRGIVGHDITIVDTIAFRNTSNRQSVAHTITVSPLATAQELSISLTDNLTVTQAINEIDSFVEESVTETLLVTETIRVSPVQESILDHITVTTSGAGFPSVRYLSVLHGLFVTDLIKDQSNHDGVTHNIGVDLNLRTTFQVQVVQHDITINEGITDSSGAGVLVQGDIVVTPVIYVWQTPNRQSVTHNVLVVCENATKTPRVEDGVQHFIGVSQFIGVSVLTVTPVLDVIAVTQTIVARTANNHQAVTHNITVNQALRSSPNYQYLTENVTVSTRLAIFDWTVKHRITVTSLPQKINEKTITHEVTVTPTVDRQVIFGKSIIDTLSMTQTVYRGAIWYRSVTQVLIIPDESFLKQFSFWPDPLVISVVTGRIVTKDIVLKSKLNEIKLPAALLGNSTSNVDEVKIQRSMNSHTLVLIKSSDREKLKLQFRVSAAKAREMMIFMQENMSELITLTNWDAEVWMGRFTNNPFDMTNAGRWATVREFVTFEVEFEGTKVG